MMAVSTVTAPIMTSTTRATVKILRPIESRGPPWMTSLNLMAVVPCSMATLAGVGCPGRPLDERRVPPRERIPQCALLWQRPDCRGRGAACRGDLAVAAALCLWWQAIGRAGVG